MWRKIFSFTKNFLHHKIFLQKIFDDHHHHEKFFRKNIYKKFFCKIFLLKIFWGDKIFLCLTKNFCPRWKIFSWRHKIFHQDVIWITMSMSMSVSWHTWDRHVGDQDDILVVSGQPDGHPVTTRLTSRTPTWCPTPMSRSGMSDPGIRIRDSGIPDRDPGFRNPGSRIPDRGFGPDPPKTPIWPFGRGGVKLGVGGGVKSPFFPKNANLAKFAIFRKNAIFRGWGPGELSIWGWGTWEGQICKILPNFANLANLAKFAFLDCQKTRI